MKKNAKGFTLVEIMIVVAIIGLLLAIAWPNFKAMRRKSILKTAQSSLRQIDGAVQEALVDEVTIASWTEANVSNAVVPKYIKTWPSCPGDGSWLITNETPLATFPASAGYTPSTFSATDKVEY